MFIESLANIFETYEEVRNKCVMAKNASEKNLKDFHTSMKECQEKVEQTLSEKLLVHIRDRERPPMLLKLQQCVDT